jgi:NAD-dependent SIR2 family protein deacetylase
MNIDGLHRALPSLGPPWSVAAPDGLTLEMHGCALDVVCERCADVSPLSPPVARAFKAAAAAAPGAAAAAGPRCAALCAGPGARPGASPGPAAAAPRGPRCGGPLRPRVMLYDDPSEALIAPPFEASLSADVAAADVILWVGISFEQSASVEHFRRARRALQAAGRDAAVPHLLVNPAAGDAAFNLCSAVANADALRLLRCRESADEFLGQLAGVAPEQARPARGPRGKRRRRGGGAEGAGGAAGAAEEGEGA